MIIPHPLASKPGRPTSASGGISGADGSLRAVDTPSARRLLRPPIAALVGSRKANPAHDALQRRVAWCILVRLPRADVPVSVLADVQRDRHRQVHEEQHGANLNIANLASVKSAAHREDGHAWISLAGCDCADGRTDGFGQRAHLG
jgi:hypothetical protein